VADLRPDRVAIPGQKVLIDRMPVGFGNLNRLIKDLRRRAPVCRQAEEPVCRNAQRC